MATQTTDEVTSVEGEAILTTEQVDLPNPGERVTVIRFNQPQKRNPLDWDTITALWNALRDAEADRSVRVVLVTGSGPAFSAGGDLKSYVQLQQDPIEYPLFLEDVHNMFLYIRAM